MFLTVQAFLPDATGLSKADAICDSEATLAGVPGSYKALLATTTTSALSRLNLGGSPWVRLDGVQVVENPLDLGASKLLTTPNVTSSRTYSTDNVLTGAQTPVLQSNDLTESCDNWTMSTSGAVGSANVTHRFFNDGSPSSCDKSIYCFED